MRAPHHVGAAAPGLVTPAESDEPAKLGSSGGFRGQVRTDDHDCAEADAKRKRAALATAHAALLGIEARPLDGGAWLLRHANGGPIGTVHGLDDLVAAVAGFEAAANDVRQLVQRMRGAR